MARAAVLGRLNWQVGSVTGVRDEAAGARTITIDLPDWPGHAAGQHVDVRLTAPDGYSAQRSYSIASAPDGPQDRADRAADRRRRGVPVPHPDSWNRATRWSCAARSAAGSSGTRAARSRCCCSAGGSGDRPADVDDPDPHRGRPDHPVPAAVLGPQPGRHPVRRRAGRTSPCRERPHRQLRVHPDRPAGLAAAGRIDAGLLASAGFTPGSAPGSAPGGSAADGWPPDAVPAVFACGPTGFVEAAARLLVAPATIPP